MFNAPGLRRVCRESYNDPLALYEVLKRRGMTMVTITDHDSIDAAESLRKFPDFFLSEEATVRLPSRTEMHMGIYGISERDHQQIQKRRDDFVSLLMYLKEKKLFFSANHIFSSLTGERESEDFKWFAFHIPAFEIRNGQMWRQANACAERLAKRFNIVGIGGSDSHTNTGAGLTFTEVAGAETAEDFLTAVRAGRGSIHGAHGGYQKLTWDVYRIIGGLIREKPWILPLVPIALLVPAFTAGHWLNEIRFCKKWAAQAEAREESKQRLSGMGVHPQASSAG